MKQPIMKDDTMIVASMSISVASHTVERRAPVLVSKLTLGSNHKERDNENMIQKAPTQGRPPMSPSSLKRKRSPSPPSAPKQVGKQLSEMAQGRAALGQMNKAFQLWNQALELQQKKLHSQHPLIADTLLRRGSAHAELEQWYAAVLDLERASHIYQANEHDELASDTLILLAEAQERMGRFDEALTNLEMALALKQKLKDEQAVARLFCLIGNAHHQQRNYQQARSSYRLGLERYEQAGVDKSHPHVVWATRRATDRSLQGHLFWNQAEKETRA